MNGNEATMRGGRYGAYAARKRQAAIVHRGAARRAAQGARSEIELSRGGGLYLRRDFGGRPRWQDRGRAHELRRDAAVPRRRDGRRRGDDCRGAGGGDVSGRHEARDGTQSHRVMTNGLKSNAAQARLVLFVVCLWWFFCFWVCFFLVLVFLCCLLVVCFVLFLWFFLVFVS